MHIKSVLFRSITFVIALFFLVEAQSQKRDYPVKPVPFTQVKIIDNFWQQRLETNREITIPYTFAKSEETGRISNFAKAGGLEDGELNFAIDPNLFGGLGKISKTGKRKAVSTTIKLIPYYAWAHREIGEMAVWLKAE